MEIRGSTGWSPGGFKFKIIISFMFLCFYVFITLVSRFEHLNKSRFEHSNELWRLWRVSASLASLIIMTIMSYIILLMHPVQRIELKCHLVSTTITNHNVRFI